MEPDTVSPRHALADLPQASVASASNALGLRRRGVKLSSGHCCYVDEGVGDTPIVLLHGAPLTSLGFVRVIHGLRHQYRVIAPDFPGFGGSLEGPHFSGSLQAYADFVCEFVSTLGLAQVFLYVNDSSGCIGLAAAAEIRERVAGIVVADTVPLPLTGRAWPVKLLLKYVLGAGLMRFINRKFNLLPWLVASVAPFLKPFTRDERAVLVGQFETDSQRDRVMKVFHMMGAEDGFMQRTAQRVQERLSQVPALLLYGQFDPMRLIGGVSCFSKLFDRTTVSIIPREEHFPILASGARVAQEVGAWMAAILAEGRADGRLR
jgi:haloalkane dehalogenase